MSGLGVHLGGGPCGDVTVASVGQADDVVLMSSSIHNLRNLVQLTENYCDTFKVTLVPEKTKLLAFGRQTSLKLYYDKLTSDININNNNIQFSDEAEHVGILRSVHGSLPSLLARFTAHCRAVMAVLHIGMARGHRSNPASQQV